MTKDEYYNEVLKRAAMFEHIAAVIGNIGGLDQQRMQIRPGVSNVDGAAPARSAADENISLLPRILVHDHLVYCNGRNMDLSRRPTMARLFREFYNAPGQQLSRAEVRDRIYRNRRYKGKSARLDNCIKERIVQLISRSRRAVKRELCCNEDRGIDWFAYDPTEETWQLFRLKPEYIRERLMG